MGQLCYSDDLFKNAGWSFTAVWYKLICLIYENVLLCGAGIAGELYYVRNGIINDYALSYSLRVGTDVNSVYFDWQSLRKTPPDTQVQCLTHSLPTSWCDLTTNSSRIVVIGTFGAFCICFILCFYVYIVCLPYILYLCFSCIPLYFICIFCAALWHNKSWFVNWKPVAEYYFSSHQGFSLELLSNCIEMSTISHCNLRQP